MWDQYSQPYPSCSIRSRIVHSGSIPTRARGCRVSGDVVFGFPLTQRGPWACLVVLFGIDVIPLGGVSAILVIIQATVLGQWCFLCLVTAVISLILVYWAYDEVWSSITYLRRVWQRTHDRSILWTVFWGGYHPEAEAVVSGSR